MIYRVYDKVWTIDQNDVKEMIVVKVEQTATFEPFTKEPRQRYICNNKSDTQYHLIEIKYIKAIMNQPNFSTKDVIRSAEKVFGSKNELIASL